MVYLLHDKFLYSWYLMNATWYRGTSFISEAIDCQMFSRLESDRKILGIRRNRIKFSIYWKTCLPEMEWEWNILASIWPKSTQNYIYCKFWKTIKFYSYDSNCLMYCAYTGCFKSVERIWWMRVILAMILDSEIITVILKILKNVHTNRIFSRISL